MFLVRGLRGSARRSGQRRLRWGFRGGSAVVGMNCEEVCWEGLGGGVLWHEGKWSSKRNRHFKEYVDSW